MKAKNVFSRLYAKLFFIISFWIYKISSRSGTDFCVFYFDMACYIARYVLVDVMLAEKLYRSTPEGTPEEWEASALCMSFW